MGKVSGRYWSDDEVLARESVLWVTELIKTYTFDSTLTDGIVVTNITIVSTVYDDTTWCYVSYRSNHILDYSN